MNGVSRAWAALACAGLALAAPADRQVVASAPRCAPSVRVVTRLPERVDSLLAMGASGAAVALVGPVSSGTRYLPHDNLTLLTWRDVPAWRINLPLYVTPPGLVAGGSNASTLYAVVDSAILLIDPRTGARRARIPLDMQALGWPAAVAATNGGRLYVVGQPSHGWTAVVEALSIGAAGAARVVWRARLGLFHAGIWLGRAQARYLIVYVPGTYDTVGTVSVLDDRTGALHAAYAVPAPPIAVDPAANRLYVDDAGSIRALDLHGGRPVASVAGRAPLAPARGLVAFVQGDGITLAGAGTLRVRGHVTLPGVTALVVTPDDNTLLAGLRGGLARINLAGCAAA